MNKDMQIDGKTIELTPSRVPGAPLVVLHTVQQEGEQVRRQIRELLPEADFSLACIGGMRWDDELSPWPSDALRAGDAPFGGEGRRYLQSLTEIIFPSVVSALPEPPAEKILAGYSLAGLFAVYALFETDIFDRAVSASGSFWYPGFLDFAACHAFLRAPRSVYLSLGDREARTGHPVLRQVGENTERLYALLRKRNVPAVLESNPGNHFCQPDVRMAKGIVWSLRAAVAEDADGQGGGI